MDYRERWELKHYLIGQILERRIRLFHVVLVLLLLVFLLDFWNLQGIQGQDYYNLAENNRLREIPMAPTRGDIYDRHGAIIASTRPSLSLVVRRESSQNLDEQLRDLALILDRPYEDLAARLEGMKDLPLFEPLVLVEDVGLETLARIEARRERFPSIEVHESVRRHYPRGALMAHGLGFVGLVSQSQLNTNQEGVLRGDIVGKSGMERQYDRDIRGTRGWKVVSVNNLGRRMGGERVGQNPAHGQPLQLTIDLALQEELTAALGDEVGSGVFLDPWTGEVLAIASSPAFDPNRFADGISAAEWNTIANDPLRPLHDRAIASFFAPGSTFKILMAIAAVESKIISPDRTYFCNGSVMIHNRRRLCWKPGGHGHVSMRQALAQSCNVYFYQVGNEIGIDTIQRYGEMFELGRPTGIDLPGEERAILPSRAWKLATYGEPWYAGDTVSVAIGQGYVAATPIQMARMVSGVATGGSLPRPYLNRQNARPPQKLPISSETLRLVREGLRDVVRAGTARRAELKGITVAGKTGTAQVFRHSAGIDAQLLPKAERDHAWFVGYAPAEDPRIAFAVVIEHGGHGGLIAAPVARRVLEVFFSEPRPTPPLPTAVADARTENDRVGSPTTR